MGGPTAKSFYFWKDRRGLMGRRGLLLTACTMFYLPASQQLLFWWTQMGLSHFIDTSLNPYLILSSQFKTFPMLFIHVLVGSQSATTQSCRAFGRQADPDKRMKIANHDWRYSSQVAWLPPFVMFLFLQDCFNEPALLSWCIFYSWFTSGAQTETWANASWGHCWQRVPWRFFKQEVLAFFCRACVLWSSSVTEQWLKAVSIPWRWQGCRVRGADFPRVAAIGFPELGTFHRPRSCFFDLWLWGPKPPWTSWVPSRVFFSWLPQVWTMAIWAILLDEVSRKIPEVAAICLDGSGDFRKKACSNLT